MQKFKNIKRLWLEFKRGEELNVPTDNLRTIKIDGESENSANGGNNEAKADILSMTQKELIEFVIPLGVQMPASYNNGVVFDSDNLSIPDAYLIDSEILSRDVPEDLDLSSIEPFYVASVKQLREKFPYIEQFIIEANPESSLEELEPNISGWYTQLYMDASDVNTEDTKRRELFRESPSTNYIACASIDGGLYVDVIDITSSGGFASKQITVEGESFYRYEADEIDN